MKQNTKTIPEIKKFNKLTDHRSISARLNRIDNEFTAGFRVVNKYADTVTIFGGARFKEDEEPYLLARNMAGVLAREGYAVVTGGGGGIMEAGNRGAFEAHGDSIGLNINLPHEQVLNEYTTDDMPFRYFFARKVMLAYDARGYIFLPGGFGTLDEFFEVLTLIQTHKMPQVPIILLGKDFWQGLDDFLKEILRDEYKTISKGDEKLYHITDDVEEAVELINKSRLVPTI